MSTNCNEHPCNHELCKELASSTCRKQINIQNYHCCCGCAGSGSDGSGDGRIMLTEDLEIYVRKDGNDSNDGFTDSPDGAFLTINAAIHSLHRFNAWDNAIKIVVHEGTYEEDVVFDQSLATVGYKTLTLVAFAGEKVIVTNDTTSYAILVNGAKAIYLEGLTANISKQIENSYCIFAEHFGNLYCNNCTVSSNGFSFAGFGCVDVSCITINGTTNVNLGNCFYVFVNSGCAVTSINGTINTQNTSVSTGYIHSNIGCVYSNATFTGSATGRRYLVQLNGLIHTAGKGINYFPGTVAGIVATGGQYM